MFNPFTEIELKLSNIENLLLDIKNSPAQKQGNDQEKPLRLKDAAEYLGIAPQTLYSYISQRKIKPHKPGKHNLFYKDDLDQFIRGETIASQPDPSQFFKRNKKARI